MHTSVESRCFKVDYKTNQCGTRKLFKSNMAKYEWSLTTFDHKKMHETGSFMPVETLTSLKLKLHIDLKIQKKISTLTLLATSFLNDRKMRPLHSDIQKIRICYRKPWEEEFLNSHDGLSSFKLTTAGQPAQCGQIGRHCLAGISKGHRRNSKFFLPLALYI